MDPRCEIQSKYLDAPSVTAYSYTLGRAEKLLEEARNNPRGMSFKDFEHLLDLKGWRFKRQKGSHRLWYSPTGYRLPIQPNGSKAKGYQVSQFLKQFDKESSGNG